MTPTSMTWRHRVAPAGCFAIACLLMTCGSPAWGQWQQLHKLTAEDAAGGCWFGFSVSASGNTMVVGAYQDHAAGVGTGCAYVFDAITGGQVHKLNADDPGVDDYFGVCVSVSGNTTVIGAWRNDDAGSEAGAAYVFDVITGEQLHKLTADDAAPYDYFGCSVSVSGNTVAVGAPFDDDMGSDSGSVYVFDAETGRQLHKLTADDGAGGEHFGLSVSVSGSTIAIGARNDDDAGTDSGSAYIFDAVTGDQLHKLTADDAEEGDYFGRSISTDGRTVVIGACQNDDAGSQSGSAYVFDTTTGQQLHKLTADDAAEEDRFGCSVSVDGNTIVVGAKYDDDAGTDSGAAYVFDRNTGAQVQKLTAEDAAAEDGFGVSVSLSGNMIIAGAPEDGDAGSESGSAYVFSRPDPCPADVNDDDTVDIDDIFAVLAAWGPCEDCPEDINDDGVVDIDDLFAVLAAWGPCP